MNSLLTKCDYIIQLSSVAQWCPTLWNPKDGRKPGFHDHHQLPELAQTHVHRVSNAIQPSHPLLLPPSIFPSIRVFSNEYILFSLLLPISYSHPHFSIATLAYSITLFCVILHQMTFWYLIISYIFMCSLSSTIKKNVRLSYLNYVNDKDY